MWQPLAPRPSPPLRPSGGLATTCRILAPARLWPLPRHLKPHSPDVGLTIGGSLGLGSLATGLNGILGVIKPSAVPPPPEENQLGGRISLLDSSVQRPTSYVTCPTTQESLLSGQGRSEDKHSSRGEERKERSHLCEACAHQPPYPKSGATGAPEPAPGARAGSALEPASSAGREKSTADDFRAESARSSGPSRRN